MQFEWHDDGGFTAWDDDNCFCIGRDCGGTCENCDPIQDAMSEFLSMSPMEQDLMFGVIRMGLMLVSPQHCDAFDVVVQGLRSLSAHQQQAIKDYHQRTITRR